MAASFNLAQPCLNQSGSLSQATDVKDEDAEGGDAERVRRDLGETCHNDKPGRNDGDGGEKYEDGRSKGGKQVGR